VNRSVTLLMLVLAFVCACAKKDKIEVYQNQETAFSATLVTNTDSINKAAEVEANKQPARVEKRYKDLVLNYENMVKPKSFGFAPPSACEYYKHAVDWDNLRRDLRSVRNSRINTDSVAMFSRLATKASARTILLIESDTATGEISSDNPYLYTKCDGRLSGDVLDDISNVMDMVENLDINPDSVGLTAKAVRSKFAKLLGMEIRRDIKFGGGRWLGCRCETSIPLYYNQFRFKREELGLSEAEWKIFLNGPPPSTRT